MTTRTVLIAAAVAESAVGLALIFDPAIVTRLLFGSDVSGIGIALGRITGFALVSQSAACWPAPRASTYPAALRGMLTYNALAMLYLSWLALRAEWVGISLWVAITIHAVLTAFLARAWLNERRHP